MLIHSSEPVQITVVRGEKIDFRGAAIVQENGQEIPITEQMIQRTLEHMVHEWESAYVHAHSGKRWKPLQI